MHLSFSPECISIHCEQHVQADSTATGRQRLGVQTRLCQLLASLHMPLSTHASLGWTRTCCISGLASGDGGAAERICISCVVTKSASRLAPLSVTDAASETNASVTKLNTEMVAFLTMTDLSSSLQPTKAHPVLSVAYYDRMVAPAQTHMRGLTLLTPLKQAETLKQKSRTALLHGHTALVSAASHALLGCPPCRMHWCELTCGTAGLQAEAAS